MRNEKRKPFINTTPKWSEATPADNFCHHEAVKNHFMCVWHAPGLNNGNLGHVVKVLFNVNLRLQKRSKNAPRIRFSSLHSSISLFAASSMNALKCTGEFTAMTCDDFLTMSSAVRFNSCKRMTSCAWTLSCGGCDKISTEFRIAKNLFPITGSHLAASIIGAFKLSKSDNWWNVIPHKIGDIHGKRWFLLAQPWLHFSVHFKASPQFFEVNFHFKRIPWRAYAPATSLRRDPFQSGSFEKCLQLMGFSLAAN